MADTALLIEPDELEALCKEPGVLVVDLSRAETHARYHIPGAVFLDYGRIVTARPPVGGLLPDDAQLGMTLSAIGAVPDHHIVAYDDEGGGKAARLLWTLEILGHRRYSLLNGGLHAWAKEKHLLTRSATAVSRTRYLAQADRASEAIADREYILAHLHDPEVALLDTRSPEEYDGSQRFALRGGHIPGAVNMDWTLAMDPDRNLRLKSPAALNALLAEREITPDKTVVAYCQTHHRSAHTYIMLKYLGYKAKGYEGSWSDWGNRMDTPVE